MSEFEENESLVLEEGIILCWNRDYPEAWPLEDHAAAKAECDRGGYALRYWSVGRRKNIEPGTKAFLLSQGQQFPRGLLGYGIVDEPPFPDEHWQDSSKTTNYVSVIWVDLLPLDDPIPVPRLVECAPGIPWATGIQGSGYPVSATDADALLVAMDAADVAVAESGPGELGPGTYWEGAAVTIQVNRYERDRAARAACLAHHGYSCQACEVDLTETYGDELGRRAIHVHHVVPMAKQGGARYRVDPINDLVPLCPNCHNVIHKTQPVQTVAEFRREVLRLPN